MFLFFFLRGRVVLLGVLVLRECQLVVYLARPTPAGDRVVLDRARAVVDSRLVLPLFVLIDALFDALLHYFLRMLLRYLPK